MPAPVRGEAAPEAMPHAGCVASQDPSLRMVHETGTPALSPYLEKWLQPQTGQAAQTLPCGWVAGWVGVVLSPLAWALGVPFPLTASSLAFTPRHFAGNSPCSSLWGAALPNRIEPDLHQGHWRSVLTWGRAVPLRRLEDRWVLTTHTPPGPQRDLKQKARPASDILCAQSGGYYWKF